MQPEDLTKPKKTDDKLEEERADRQLTNHSIQKLLGLNSEHSENESKKSKIKGKFLN